MRYKSTLILLVAVIIAGLLAYSLSQQPTSKELREQRGRLLPGFDADRVRRLTVGAPDGEIVCQRSSDEDEWRITRPVRARAQDYSVENILSRFGRAKPVWAVRPAKGEAIDLAQYGLAEPRRTVTIVEGPPKGGEWTVLVGEETGAGDSVYVTIEGKDAVFAIEKAVVERTDVTLADLRSKTLARRIPPADLRKVVLSARESADSPAFRGVCEKAGDRWELQEPFFDLADRDEVEDLVDRVFSHRIGKDDFLADDVTKLGEYGLDDPDLTLSVEGPEHKLTFLLAREEQEGEVRCYAANKDEVAVVEVPGDLFDGLRKTPEELRERELLPAGGKPAEMRIAGPSGTLVLKKAGDGWRIAGESPAGADAAAVNDVLGGLRDAEVREFVADDPEALQAYGLSEEQRTLLKLLDDEGAERAGLAFGKPTAEGMVYVRRIPYPPVLRAPQGEYYDRVARGRTGFLDRGILAEEPADAVELRLRVGTEQFVCTRKEDGTWQLKEPVDVSADADVVRRKLELFADLRAAEMVAEKVEDASAYGLDKPRLELSVAYEPHPGAATEEERRVRTLLVGEGTSEPADGRYARLAKGDAVFVLGPSDVERLRESPVPRTVCRAEELRRMTFRRGGTELRLAYDSGADEWTGPGNGKLTKAQLEAARRAAALLRDFEAVDVADYVEKAPAFYGFDEPYLTVELQSETAGGKRVVIGDPTDGGRYAKGPAGDFVLIAAPEDVEVLDAAFRFGTLNER